MKDLQTGTPPLPHEIDPFLIEVIRHALSAAAEEMSLVMTRSARSSVLREGGDLSSTITDADGELAAQGRDLPMHLGVMAYTVKHFLKCVPRERLRPGDAWLLNLPDIGGNHLPDVKLIRPIFHRGTLVAFAVNLAHWPDIGGAWPGSYYAQAFDSIQEGLRIPPIRLFTSDGVDREKLDFILANVRGPVEREGDIMAQMAATRAGERRVQELCDEHGAEVVTATLARLCDLSEIEMREGLRAIPDGTYRGVDHMDLGGADGGPAAVRVAITIAGDEAEFDLSESDDIVTNYYNTTPFVVGSAVAYAARLLSGRDMQQNGGTLRPIRIITRPGSLLDPGPNKPVVGGNHETSQRIVDAIFRAMEHVVPERISAGGPTTTAVLILSEPCDDGTWKTFFEVHGGGEGARHDRDGCPAVRVHLGNTGNTPVEMIEALHAIEVERQELRSGSGGNGQHRGGDGYTMSYRILALRMMLTTCVDRMVVPPFGIQGGEDGKPYRLTLVRGEDGSEHAIPGVANLQVGRGDRIIIETCGGGGFGKPRQNAALPA
ncbi:MAG: hydantoinase B/oxoprolinase family protein [Proteobacteria bacterium]|nr:hydantoinase B/oxoprolinase family protein [Pseudomonadota bacterium]MDA0951610.1 hydantoinase B/oxoprolinase family protein [Pseudomonadota bacterium]